MVEAKGRKIVIVDDDEVIVDLYRMILVGEGHKVVGFGCPEEALVKLDKMITEGDPPQVVVVDNRMVSMDGLELIQCLRNNPLTSGIAIVFCSADVSGETECKVKKLLAIGDIDRWAVKPLDYDELVDAAQTKRRTLNTPLDN